MTEILTRQQRRALGRQKHHKHIQVGGTYQATKALTTVHPITNKPLFEIVKVETVTLKEVVLRSPYGNKMYLSINSFDQTYIPLTKNADSIWEQWESEAKLVKGQMVIPDEVFQKFLERNPEMREHLVRSDDKGNPIMDTENNLVVKEV